MKKYIILVLIALLMGALFVGVAAAPAGKSNVAHLYLYEKDASWNIVDGGAWGKMKYNLSGEEFEFVFNGHGLVPNVDYTLVCFPIDWPNCICLESGTANIDGNVNIAGSVNTLDLTDAKIWLVPSDKVNCNTGKVAWSPADYLMEGDVITFDDTDD